jgi:hypothetical protein
MSLARLVQIQLPGKQDSLVNPPGSPFCKTIVHIFILKTVRRCLHVLQNVKLYTGRQHADTVLDQKIFRENSVQLLVHAVNPPILSILLFYFHLPQQQIVMFYTSLETI